MKRTVLFALMITLVFLTSCAGAGVTDEQRVEEYRLIMAEANITVTADVTAGIGEKVVDYRLKCETDGEKSHVEVLEPELIAGVTVTVSESSGELSYEGVILEANSLTDTGLSPVSALPNLAAAYARGHISALWRETYEETAAIVMDMTAAEDTTMRLWINAETMSPLMAEFICGDTVVTRCTILSWNVV